MRQRLARSIAASVLVAGALVVPRAARAESSPAPPACRVQVLPKTASVPANLPALLALDTSSPGLKATVAITLKRGAAASGGAFDLDAIPDPRATGVTLFVPKAKATFEVGAAYSLSTTTTCSSSSGLPPADESRTFTATAAVPLPTRIGSVRELADGRAMITPSQELAAYLTTTQFEVSVDGQSVGATRYGLAEVQGAELQLALSSFYVWIGGATTVGGAISVCKDGFIGKEKHDVTLVAHVAGAETDPEPLHVPLSATCSAPASAEALPDAGADDRGAPGGDGGGCAVNGRDPLGGLALLFGAGAGLTVLLRRRRRV